MIKHYGKVNLTKFAEQIKSGPGTATRIKEQRTSVGIEILDNIAAEFHLQTWQLLVPAVDLENLPTLDATASGWPIAPNDLERLADLPPHARNFVQGYLRRCIEEQEVISAKRNG